MEKVVEGIVSILHKNSIVNDENIDVVRYGIEIVLLKILFFLTILFIGIITNNVVNILIFMLFYKPLRTYAGGYHAKTRIGCYIVSVLMLLLMLISVRFVSMFDALTNAVYVIAVISGVIIWILAPVETSNKPLDSAEKSRYRLISRIVLLVEFIIGGLCLVFDLRLFSLAIALVFAFTGFFLFLCHIQEGIRKAISKSDENIID
ncbi:MAG: accessory gene regulator B family protein [Clostridiales bacterium]|nr:accessory gene regulator B family protein [Clostridiales bacterium]